MSFVVCNLWQKSEDNQDGGEDGKENGFRFQGLPRNNNQDDDLDGVPSKGYFPCLFYIQFILNKDNIFYQAKNKLKQFALLKLAEFADWHSFVLSADWINTGADKCANA